MVRSKIDSINLVKEPPANLAGGLNAE